MYIKREIIKVLLLVFSIGVILIGLGLNTSEAQESNKGDKRLESLIEWGKELVDTPLKVVVKWQGEWSNEGKKSTLEVAQQLAINMELSLPQVVSNTDHVTYRSITSVNGITVIFHWQVLSEEKSYMIVTLESHEASQQSSLLHLQNRIQTQINLMNMKAEWNASVQGNVIEGQSIANTMADVETKLQSHLEFSQVESYQDEMTLSHSYRAPMLNFNLVSGDHYMDLQTAVHHDEILGENRITIGFPIITVEF
ncbi:YwmB family TATA-box binding protein [Paenibacillus sp. FA6]|uniref:YwmB family TATA-box binding protein n=1 Tax=Paenibacillus sp. FA6 TaxID=3413029 RepID=UPI003F65A97D